jgi:hypothetical protein
MFGIDVPIVAFSHCRDVVAAAPLRSQYGQSSSARASCSSLRSAPDLEVLAASRGETPLVVRSAPMKWRIVWMVLGLLAASCGTTRLGGVWELEGYDGPPFERVMIVGLASTPELRALYENGFVDRLANERILALASVNMVPNVADIDRETVGAWVAEYALDGVIVTRLVNVSHETEYRPPIRSLGGWYGAWAVPSSPGRVIETVKVSLETSFYATKTEQLVYSAVSRTYNPNDGRKMAKAVTDLLVADVMARGYLKTKER